LRKVIEMHRGEAIYLVINADDLGMSHSINLGILDAFVQGIVTQSSIMAPTPAFADGAALAREYNIPICGHLTLAADWDRVRWAPLTKARELSGVDGMLPMHPRELIGRADPKVVEAEFIAQIEAIQNCGLTLVHLDHHMEMVFEDVATALCERYSLCCRDWLTDRADLSLGFDSLLNLSPMPADQKEETLIEYLNVIGPGAHLIVCHPARDGADLDGLCSPALPGRRLWAYEHRLSDLSVLTSEPVKQAIANAGIQLVTTTELQKRHFKRLA